MRREFSVAAVTLVAVSVVLESTVAVVSGSSDCPRGSFLVCSCLTPQDKKPQQLP